MVFDSTVSSKGQVTIPIEIRRSLGLRDGDKVRFVAEKGTVSIRPVVDEQPDPLGQYLGALGNFAGGLKEITAWVDDIRGRTPSARARRPVVREKQTPRAHRG
jgi:AbrB family looped-hinge helix DNA binding protein